MILLIIDIYLKNQREQNNNMVSLSAFLKHSLYIESIKKEEVYSEMNDVVLNKTTTIERCVNRIHEVYENEPKNLEDFMKQDSIILNIQRACEASIDLAMHIVSERKLGVPKASREAFKLLQDAHLIDTNLAETLMNMVGFRDIAVHDYQALELEILQAILEKHIVDFKAFTKIVLQLEKE